jgi:hypothetical protein
MARVVALPGGRASKFQYGTQAQLSFTIKFPTDQATSSASGFISTGTEGSSPTIGTIIIAGITVTLVAADLINTAAVAAKIAAASITGYTIYYDILSNPSRIILVNNTIGVTTKPTLALGTATNILFVELGFNQGTPITIGAQDDIEVEGRVPMTLTVSFTGGSIPTITASNGPDFEQESGTLTYGSALTLGTVNGIANSVVITNPVHYIRLTTQTGNTTAALYINR